jgi:hypothetical protein
MSTLVPGGNPTRNLTGFDGYACANPGSGTADAMPAQIMPAQSGIRLESIKGVIRDG